MEVEFYRFHELSLQSQVSFCSAQQELSRYIVYVVSLQGVDQNQVLMNYLSIFFSFRSFGSLSSVVPNSYVSEHRFFPKHREFYLHSGGVAEMLVGRRILLTPFRGMRTEKRF